ncbi:MAG: hypothetical protein ACNA8H_09895 [Anaerolineales bacterium]
MERLRNKETQDRLMRICAWCTLPIPPGADTFGFGAQANQRLKLEGQAGKFVSIKLTLSNKTTIAYILPEGSPAKESGYDLFFIACSQDCAEQLKEAFELELDVYNGSDVNHDKP